MGVGLPTPYRRQLFVFKGGRGKGRRTKGEWLGSVFVCQTRSHKLIDGLHRLFRRKTSFDLRPVRKLDPNPRLLRGNTHHFSLVITCCPKRECRRGTNSIPSRFQLFRIILGSHRTCPQNTIIRHSVVGSSKGSLKFSRSRFKHLIWNIGCTPKKKGWERDEGTGYG